MLRLLNRILAIIVLVFVLGLMYGFVTELIIPGQGADSAEAAPSASELEAVLQEMEASGGQFTSIAAVLPIVLIAGFSDAVGHAFILFANQVKPSRFTVTIVFNALLFIVGYLIWVGMVSLISFTVFDRDTAFIRAAFAVGVSYLPLIYGFLIALPYFGVLVSNIIYLSAALYLIGALQVFFPYTQGDALVCAVVSFGAVIVFRLTVGRPILWMRGKLLNAVAGADLKRDMDDALSYIASKGAEA